MTVSQLYRQVRDLFRDAQIELPELDAKLLVSAALGISISDLMLRGDDPVSETKSATAKTHAEKRLAGMPVGRILGEREFYGRRFVMNPATLEPRSDTEALIDAVLAMSVPTQEQLFCDLGTGTGAIAVTLLAEMKRSRMVAVDLSFEALSCASENADLHEVSDRFLPLCADYASALAGAKSGVFDWVVSNPPYIRTHDLGMLSPEVIQHDPVLALDGGVTGLDSYVRIIAQAEMLLKSGGRIALEIGFDQAGAVEKQLRHHSFGAIEIVKDLSGNDRVLLACRQ
ncbi:peptide chain release factor N(5)-glutamine methyltransferase [uncultured Roseibium sp.]|uniref:peptide chain release factor N(5)-glutamine methyltransferase n=1 Tax=uncultured Roseibium sp. TaxID=1936171 RepID=UPI00262BBFEC|nr:peptide chain release factor N(5)-glutamine methyltransferase [uncultured Roseibium sp.]